MEHSYSLAVYETRDYSLFKGLTGNREKSPVQIKKLVSSIEKDPAFTKISPIIVNERMEIIDGQHRLAAYQWYLDNKQVAYPIYFVIREGIGLKEARTLNAGAKPWAPRDYAQAYAMSGNGEYSKYLKYSKATGLNHDILVRFLAPSNYGLANFRDGGFKVEDEKLSRTWFRNLEDVGMVLRANMENHPDWKHRSFAIGLLNLMVHPEYDHDRMLEQLESNSNYLRGVEMKNSEISKALQMIYNARREDKVALIG